MPKSDTPKEDTASEQTTTDAVNYCTIYTDASIARHLGKEVGGWAATIRVNGEKYSVYGRNIKPKNNNRMEMLAAIGALRNIPEDYKGEIVLVSDSEAMIDRMKNRNTRMKSPRQWEVLDELDTTLTINWTWTPSHVGNPRNQEVDAMARRAAKSTGRAPRPTKISVLENIQEMKSSNNVNLNREIEVIHRSILETNEEMNSLRKTCDYCRDRMNLIKMGAIHEKEINAISYTINNARLEMIELQKAKSFLEYNMEQIGKKINSKRLEAIHKDLDQAYENQKDLCMDFANKRCIYMETIRRMADLEKLHAEGELNLRIIDPDIVKTQMDRIWEEDGKHQYQELTRIDQLCERIHQKINFLLRKRHIIVANLRNLDDATDKVIVGMARNQQRS